MKQIAAIGDYMAGFDAHDALCTSVRHAADALDADITCDWIPTEEATLKALADYDALWIAPGSPYRNRHNVIAAIQFARTNGVPLLATCGGFQHVVLEIAQNLLGYSEIGEPDYDPYDNDLFIAELTCHLVGREMQLTLAPGSIVAQIYNSTKTTERYYCTFGVNPAHISELETAPILFVGADSEGDARIIEIPDHPFFIATLFVPQVASTAHAPHPLVLAFCKAALA